MGLKVQVDSAASSTLMAAQPPGYYAYVTLKSSGISENATLLVVARA